MRIELTKYDRILIAEARDILVKVYNGPLTRAETARLDTIIKKMDELSESLCKERRLREFCYIKKK